MSLSSQHECRAVIVLAAMLLLGAALTSRGDDPTGTSPADAEAVLEVAPATYFHPLAPRDGDPRFRLSNLRVERHALFNQPNLVMDVERLAGEPRKDGSVQLMARTTRGGEPEVLFSTDLQAFQWSSDPKTTISAPVAPAFGVGTPDFGLELYLVRIDGEHRRTRLLFHPDGRTLDQVPKPFVMKLSNSLLHGRPLPITAPRQWLPEEQRLLATPTRAGAAPTITLIEFPDHRLAVTTAALSGDQLLLKTSRGLRLPEQNLRWLEK